METMATHVRPELLQVADTVAREKGIDREEVLEAMEQAIQKAARSRYGQETNIRADIDPQTGEMKLQRLMEVTDNVEEPARQIAANAGAEGSVVVNAIKNNNDGQYGYNAATDEYVPDMFAAGIVDPAKVTRTALQNASSVATLLLTSDALIAEAPKKDKKGGGQGHGGMDMDY